MYEYVEVWQTHGKTQSTAKFFTTEPAAGSYSKYHRDVDLAKSSTKHGRSLNEDH